MTGKEQVEAHIAALPVEQRRIMERLRQIVLDEAPPNAEEVIAYKMPSLRVKGQYALSYEAFKDHYSIFPATDLMNLHLGEEVAPYVKGKGTLQFKASEPLPEELIRRVVEIRLKDFT
jgi:uncharacterized protein YdhG (YjbR/CyaY superfamily)